jgi:predicted nucleic acid-binding protein
VFVGAGFNPACASSALLQLARSAAVVLIWSAATRAETCRVLTRIPRLDWARAAPLFLSQNERSDPLLDAYEAIEDRADRKFAALAVSTGATLVTSDVHLLAHRATFDVMTPAEMLQKLSQRT